MNSEQFIHAFFKINPSYYSNVFSEIPDFSYNYLSETCRMMSLYIKDSSLWVTDRCSQYVNVKSGQRLTTDAPDFYSNTLYILGSSVGFSWGSEDRMTIASCLQRLCNKMLKHAFRVVNIATLAARPINDYFKLKTLDLAYGDHVLLITNRLVKDEPDCVIEMTKYCHSVGAYFSYFEYPGIERMPNLTPTENYLKIHKKNIKNIMDEMENKTIINTENNIQKKEPLYLNYIITNGGVAFDLQRYVDDLKGVWLDYWHASYKVNQRVAEAIYNEIFDYNSLHKIQLDKFNCLSVASTYLSEITRQKHGSSPSILAWLEKVPKDKFSLMTEIGAIVMNCNPFTYGHLSLIEESLSLVTGLYIFVVEENKSAFPFEDRLELIKKGTAHLSSKLEIVPSGKFIISSFSFPDYFTKESKILNIDPSLDVALFGSSIAPRLNIKHRFVGEEPFCHVTKQYNSIMAKLLPPMGVTVHIHPRFEFDGEPISASRVRNLIAENKMQDIEQIVPQTTLQYIIKHSYSSKNYN